MRISNISSTSFNGLFKKKEKPQLTAEQKQYQSQGFKRGVAIGTAIPLGVGAIAGGGYYLTQDLFTPQSIVMPYEQGVTDTDEIANVLQVDGRTFEYSTEGMISIPVKYDYVQDAIEDERASVFSRFTSPDEKEKSFQAVKRLMEKQEYQQSIATVYKQDDYVYFNLTLDNLDGISVEEFKRIFDIKDGALSSYEENGIAKDWTQGEYYTGNDSHTLTKGMTLIVGEDDIDTDNISFDYN